jgi:hypothetical protein
VLQLFFLNDKVAMDQSQCAGKHGNTQQFHIVHQSQEAPKIENVFLQSLSFLSFFVERKERTCWCLTTCHVITLVLLVSDAAQG